MKKQTVSGLIAFLAGVAAIVLFTFYTELANATGKTHDDDIDIDTRTTTEQQQGQQQGQQQQAEGGAATGGDASNQLSVEGDRVENNSSNVVLVPNNNTENCLRVWGIAWGKNGESGALGIPWRSGKCDVEAAADDAFAAGERELGWWWKCQNRNLYKKFKDKGETAEQASEQCFQKAVGEHTNLATIDQLQRTVEFLGRENKRLNAVLVDERQLCKDQKDETYERCIGQLKK